MNLRHWIILGALASASAAAMAQASSAQQDPLDAAAAVPALRYTSVFDLIPPAAGGQETTPDKAWRPANDLVANPDAAHAGHQHGEATPAPAKPAPAPEKHEHKH